jgi:succinoglycan biosynthesis transport protein ExoP
MLEEREIHLRDYLRIIFKRRYTLLTFFVIVFIVVLIGTLSTKPVYKATTQVLIEKVEPYNLSMMFPYYMSYDPEFYETQYQIIKSTSVAKKVVTTLALERTYGTFFKDNKSVSSEVDNSLKIDMLANMISSGISVTPVKNSKIVNISFTSTNPEFATLIANSVAKAYMEELLEMKMSYTKNAIEWMTKKADEEKVKLEKSEKALQDYMRAQDIVTLQDKVALTPDKLTEFNTQLIKAETRRKELESLYSKVKNASLADAEAIPAVTSDPTIQSLRSEILKSEQKIEDLAKKYGAKHPAMLRAKEELIVLKDKRSQEIKRVIESIKNEYEIARTNESNLKGMLSSTKAEALNQNEKFVQYGVLTRDVETSRQLYDALIKRIKEQTATEEIQTVNVWIVEKSETPTSPIKPKKSLNILLGLIVGLFGGVGLTFFFEYLDNTIKSPDEVETKVGMSVLGTVPLLDVKDGRVETISLRDSQSVIAESYKTVRTALLLSSADKPPQNILVTSMGPEEGKTVTSVNLAITIAQSEYSVLLIDSDLRKPRIHSIFKMDNKKGLSSYLAGATTTINIVKGPVPNLSIITSGPLPPNPSELLGSNRMNDLIKVLNERFNVIIWDSPPIMTVTDSLILSKILDGTIIVTRAGKTTYEMVRRGLKMFKGRRADDMTSHVLGIVINALDLRKSDYYYYKHYNYYSAYKQEKR